MEQERMETELGGEREREGWGFKLGIKKSRNLGFFLRLVHIRSANC